MWENAVAALTEECQGRVSEGFVAAIAQCGGAGGDLPLAPGSVNPNELPDKLIEI